MAVTSGQGNPNWTRDEIILALDLYFECGENTLSNSDERVKSLSELLRLFPNHSVAVRKKSFRNADGVAFKLQNIRQLATGKGLPNVSKMDREVWAEFGGNPGLVKELADLIRLGIDIVEGIKERGEDYETFSEGRMATEVHIRRERDPRIRERLLEQRNKSKKLKCEMCDCDSLSTSRGFEETIFEAHHIIPLSVSKECITKLEDMALLCANCHRMIHRAIVLEKRWLSISEAKSIIFLNK